MTCKNTEWDSKICPHCKYDVCLIRYRYNLKPECVTGINIKMELQLTKPLTEKFADKLRREFEDYMAKCIEQNPFITPLATGIYTSNKMKD